MSRSGPVRHGALVSCVSSLKQAGRGTKEDCGGKGSGERESGEEQPGSSVARKFRLR
jgi:hypothetical protein